MKKIGSSALRLPADATSAPGTDNLGIIDDMERAADELRGEIDRGAAQELERYRVYDGVSPESRRGAQTRFEAISRSVVVGKKRR